MARPKALVAKLGGEWMAVLAGGSFAGPFDTWREAFDFAYRLTGEFRDYWRV